MFSRRTRTPEGIRLTAIGFWFILFTLLTGLAAVNTGNNALYMVLSVMLGVLTVSGLLSWQNLRHLRLHLEAPDEIFAGRPTSLDLRVTNGGRWLSRWLISATTSRQGKARLVPRLSPGGRAEGTLPVLLETRGRHRLEWLHIWSRFPFGFFRKGARQRVGLELLVYPQIFDASPRLPERESPIGSIEVRRSGRGHELFTLRDFRHGDDPRHMHWKQTARLGKPVVIEHEEERGRRLSVLFDNGVGQIRDAVRRARFERLVSEAATAATEGLRRGLEVELVTRSTSVPFGAGPAHRRRILTTLALIDATEPSQVPLAGEGSAPRLHLGVGAKMRG